MRKTIMTAGLCSLLGACATGGSLPLPQATVAQAEVALTAADNLAIQYVSLPLCPSKTGALCSSAAITANIKSASAAAYKAVKAAEASGTAGDLATANAAVAALSALVPANR